MIVKNNKLDSRLLCIAALILLCSAGLYAETIYVDSEIGRDDNPGSLDKPLSTIAQAAAAANRNTQPGPTTIKLAPGIYQLDETIVFQSSRPYTESDRFSIEATVLPDEPAWNHSLMPVILSTKDPRPRYNLDKATETYSFEIKISHVTIAGLKFLGNPLPRNWHACISRIGDDLDDLIVTQCMFVGDPDSLNIYCAVIATGKRFIVDHSVFYKCHACAVFWDGLKGVPGSESAMRYCIVDGAFISGVWTCQTAEDFQFHHNIITRSRYGWLRKKIDNPKSYKLHDSIITRNQYFSGYGVVSGPTGPTGTEVSYVENNVNRKGNIDLVKDKTSRYYLHVIPTSFGSDLGAGLFHTTR